MLDRTTVQRTPIGLILPDNLDEKEWEQLGQELYGTSEAIRWQIGDWWNYGGKKYGTADKIASKLGIERTTLYDWSLTARNVEISVRNENLGHSLHRAVRWLPQPYQVRLLNKAQKDGWNKNRMIREAEVVRYTQKTDLEYEFDDWYSQWLFGLEEAAKRSAPNPLLQPNRKFLIEAKARGSDCKEIQQTLRNVAAAWNAYADILAGVADVVVPETYEPGEPSYRDELRAMFDLGVLEDYAEEVAWNPELQEILQITSKPPSE